MLIVLSAACSPLEKVSPASAWEYADLRILSQPDQHNSPGDFIAGYSRVAGSDLQLRFDLLDLTDYPENDYYIALDYEPGGSTELPIQASADISWDSLLFLPAKGIPRVISPDSLGDFIGSSGDSAQNFGPGVPIPRIVRIPWQDYILVSINKTFLPDLSMGLQIQAFSSHPGSSEIRDTIGPFSSKALPPERAPLLLTFWDTFPAFTPAQALRKWDGAHTGPYGERHGLAILLDNIRRYSVPAVLLDLRAPASLSALDHLGVLPLVAGLQNQKLLTLPDSLPGSPSFPLFPDGLPDGAPAHYLDRANQVSESFDIPPSDILYLPRAMQELTPRYLLYFTPANNLSQLPHQISLPPQGPQEAQAGRDGLSLAIRRNLLNNAFDREMNSSSFPLLILGGSLQDSGFGDPAASSATLSYISNHPWIWPLNIDDLHTLPGETEFQYLPGSTQTGEMGSFSPSPVLATLPGTAANPLFQEAWDSAFSLFSALPPEPGTLPQLRAAYSGQPGILLAAGNWADEPYSDQNCGTDLDWDGFPECILSTGNQFAVIDPLGARLIAYFYRDNSTVHQVIAPSSQFVTGLGDPSTWILDAVDGADPAGIPGAFADSPPPWPIYNLSTTGHGISFTSPDQQIEKFFSLEDEGLIVSYKTEGDVTGRIPIAIDPWRRFSPGWNEDLKISTIEDGYQFLQEGVQVVDIISDIPLDVYSYKDSVNSLGVPEDPNYAYPPGHYLPFPLTVLGFHGQGEFEIHINPPPKIE